MDCGANVQNIEGRLQNLLNMAEALHKKAYQAEQLADKLSGSLPQPDCTKAPCAPTPRSVSEYLDRIHGELYAAGERIHDNLNRAHNALGTFSDPSQMEKCCENLVAPKSRY